MQLARVLKSFLGVSLLEAMTRERWGASKSVRNQPRMICDNNWDAEKEPQMMVGGQRHPCRVGLPSIEDKSFMKMTRPAFPEKCIDSDIEAVCKRATIIVNSEHFI